MKNIIILTAGVLFVALPAHAQIGAEGAIDIEVETGTGAGVQVDTEIQADTDSSTQGGARGEVDIQALEDVTVDLDAEVDPEAEALAATTGVADAKGSISIAANEVRGWSDEQRQEFLATVKTHAEVQSGQELEVFARGILVNDENVEAVAASEQEVRMSYRVPARLFGIFTAELPATVTVEAEGEGEARSASERVRVAFPWTRMFFSVSENVNEESLREAVATQLSGDISARASFDASTQARFLETMHAALKVKHSTEVSAAQNSQ